MIDIVVQSTPATSLGRLYPRYDEEAGILAIESSVQRTWPFGVDIDCTLVFDLDDRRVLANIDFHVPRNHWLRSQKDDDPAMIASPGDLEFAPATVKHKSFHLPIQARADDGGHRLRIEIGSAKPSRAIALSPQCIALLTDDELVVLLVSGIR